MCFYWGSFIIYGGMSEQMGGFNVDVFIIGNRVCEDSECSFSKGFPKVGNNGLTNWAVVYS